MAENKKKYPAHIEKYQKWYENVFKKDKRYPADGKFRFTKNGKQYEETLPSPYEVYDMQGALDIDPKDLAKYPMAPKYRGHKDLVNNFTNFYNEAKKIFPNWNIEFGDAKRQLTAQYNGWLTKPELMGKPGKFGSTLHLVGGAVDFNPQAVVNTKSPEYKATYKKYRAAGLDHDEATRAAIMLSPEFKQLHEIGKKHGVINPFVDRASDPERMKAEGKIEPWHWEMAAEQVAALQASQYPEYFKNKQLAPDKTTQDVASMLMPDKKPVVVPDRRSLPLPPLDLAVTPRDMTGIDPLKRAIYMPTVPSLEKDLSYMLMRK